MNLFSSNKNLQLILFGLFIWAIFSTLETISAGLYWIAENKPAHWTHLFWYRYTMGIIWCLFLPLLLKIVKWLPFDQFKWWKLVGYHFIIAIIIAPIHRFFAALLNHFIQTEFDLFNRPYARWEYIGNNFIGNALNGIVTYTVLITLLYSYFLYWRSIQDKLERTQLAADLSKAKLKNLESQLQPHFLFNSMQSISALMHKNVDQAETAMSELSDLLRLAFTKGESPKSLLSEELIFCQKYIALQQLRFQDKLEIQLNCPLVLHAALVPSMILQPFLENSIKHGFQSSGKKGRIQVNIFQEKTELVLEIIDNGQPLLKPFQIGTGFENTKSRLRFLYNDRSSFNFNKHVAGGFEVIIRIPFENQKAV